MLTASEPRELTRRQREIYEYIGYCIRNDQRPPTVRAIGVKFDIRSPNGVMCHLKALEKKGLISRDENRACGIRLVQADDHSMKWRERPTVPGWWLDLDLVAHHYAQSDIDRMMIFKGWMFGPVPSAPQ